MLRPEQLARHATLERWEPDPDIAPWVELVWSIRWELPSGVRFASQTLPHPAVSLTVERGSGRRPEVGSDPVVLTGVVTRRFDVDLHADSWVVGLKFRPGGLVALVGGRAADWRDRTLPARPVVGAPVADALSGIDPGGDPASWRAAAQDAVRLMEPRTDERYELLLEIVADMLGDPDLMTVAEVERRHGVSGRSLQRLFATYVGVSPKWVLGRYRMHDLLATLDSGSPETLTDLAHRFGWYDQAHFTRDFVRLVGVRPGDYRSRRQSTQ